MLRLSNALFCIAVIATLIVGPARARSAAPAEYLDLPYAPSVHGDRALDLFLPEKPSSAATIVFVHGGAFMYGDRKEYDVVGKALSRQGVAVAVISYRNYPQSDAHGAIRDAAKAVAWIYRNASQYALDPHRIFLVGHSSGAQIVSVLALNPAFMRSAGLDLSVIRGVMALSGPYDVRDLSHESLRWQAIDRHVYGATRARRRTISAMAYVAAASVPIITACGTSEDPFSCRQAIGLTNALLRSGDCSFVVRERGADHMGMVRALLDPTDPLEHFLLDFVNGRGRCAPVTPVTPVSPHRAASR